MARVDRLSQQHQDALLQGAGFGGALGAFIGRPLLGALAGLAYKLFTTDGLADAAKKIVGDVSSSDDPLGVLGRFIGGGPTEKEAETKSRPLHRERAAARKQAEEEQPRSSGIPGWAKALGWGTLAVAAVNVVQDLSYNFGGFFGRPYYGGYGYGYPYYY